MSWVKLVKVCYYCAGGACWRRHLNPDRKGKQNGCIMATEIALGGGDLARPGMVREYNSRQVRQGWEEPVVGIHKGCFGFWKVEPRAPCQPLEMRSLKIIIEEKKK